jgi:putative membrane protein
MAGNVLSGTSGEERLGPLAVVGLVVLPLLVGVTLAWGLSAPVQNLDRVTAAVVNNDKPVTVNGQTVPVGREFAAGLIGGTGGSGAPDDPGSDATAQPASTGPNFTWVLTNSKDAASGLQDGSYAAVVTIPSSFSASATSISGPAAKAVTATVDIRTTPATAFLDPALTDVVVQAATTTLNSSITENYLSNVYQGFNQINSSIAQAADGADQLASGASSLAGGADQLASGADQLASGLQSLDAGAASLSAGLTQLDSSVQGLPGQTAQLATGSAEVAAALDAAAASLSAVTQRFADIVAAICERSPAERPDRNERPSRGGRPDQVERSGRVERRSQDQRSGRVERPSQDQRSGRVELPRQLCTRATTSLDGLEAADQSFAELAGGADEVAAGNERLAAGMPGLVDGIEEASSGASEVARGAGSSAAGGASVAKGAGNVASGAGNVDSGAAQLSSGLDKAVKQIPTYSKKDVSTLSTVVAQPVLTSYKLPATGTQSVPLFAVVALWVGGIVLALAHRAVPSGRLLTSESSVSLAARSTGPVAAIGAGQGLVVALALFGFLESGSGPLLGLTAACVALGVVFAVVNLGLAALFGGVGRMVAVVIGVVALVVGTSSTAPAALESAAALLPTGPGHVMVISAVGVDSAWPALVALVLWGLVGLVLVLVGVVRRRTGPALVA